MKLDFHHTTFTSFNTNFPNPFLVVVVLVAAVPLLDARDAKEFLHGRGFHPVSQRRLVESGGTELSLHHGVGGRAGATLEHHVGEVLGHDDVEQILPIFAHKQSP